MKEISLRHLTGKWWEVTEDYWYGDVLIPKGFKTDLASIPRVLWSIFPPFGNYTTPAVIHDHAYKTCYNSRAEADKEFRDNCKAYGTPSWKANSFYGAVRLFGRSHYNEEV
jgi:hypothetical protein